MENDAGKKELSAFEKVKYLKLVAEHADSPDLKKEAALKTVDVLSSAGMLADLLKILESEPLLNLDKLRPTEHRKVEAAVLHAIAISYDSRTPEALYSLATDKSKPDTWRTAAAKRYCEYPGESIYASDYWKAALNENFPLDTQAGIAAVDCIVRNILSDPKNADTEINGLLTFALNEKTPEKARDYAIGKAVEFGASHGEFVPLAEACGNKILSKDQKEKILVSLDKAGFNFIKKTMEDETSLYNLMDKKGAIYVLLRYHPLASENLKAAASRLFADIKPEQITRMEEKGKYLLLLYLSEDASNIPPELCKAAGNSVEKAFSNFMHLTAKLKPFEYEFSENPVSKFGLIAKGHLHVNLGFPVHGVSDRDNNLKRELPPNLLKVFDNTLQVLVTDFARKGGLKIDTGVKEPTKEIRKDALNKRKI